jgi:hypothetical protein
MRIRVVHALIDEVDGIEVLRGLAEGSRLVPTMFAILATCVSHANGRSMHTAVSHSAAAHDASWHRAQACTWTACEVQACREP